MEEKRINGYTVQEDYRMRMNRVFAEGELACSEGSRLKHCPYAAGTDEFYWWCEGWRNVNE
jgi:ribosome modulation factor